MTPAEWTRPEHVVETLRRKWASGRYLTAAAGGHPFEPIGVSLKGPTAADALQYYEQALAWSQCWAPDRNPHLRIQTKSIGGRNGIPSNTVPARAWVDSRDRLWTLLRVTTQVDRFHTLHEQTARQDPGIARWMADHPMKVLANAADWRRLVRTTCWIRDHDTKAVYLREIDTPGVDTKFIETNKGILADLLDCVLPESRVNTSAPKSDLVARYGFRTKPIYIRLRYLGASPLPFSELTVRAEELADWSPGVRTVFVLENEITYLSLPPVPDAIAILGSGYAAALLRHLPWLDDVALCYWGDIDTHGFAILNQVRGRFPHTTSLLMDRATLLAHESHWGQEKTQARGGLTHLTPEEADLEQELRTGAYRPHLRLEQERIAITAVRDALARHWEWHRGLRTASSQDRGRGRGHSRAWPAGRSAAPCAPVSAPTGPAGYGSRPSPTNAHESSSPASTDRQPVGQPSAASDDNNPPRRTEPAVTDTWNGEPLADAKSVNEDIHYRIHDADSGALLGFGTGRGGALGAVVAHCRRVEDAHPGRHLVIRAYDGPAGLAFDRPAGP